MKGDASWSQLHRNLETPSQKQNFGNTNPTPTYASSICFGLVRNCVYVFVSFHWKFSNRQDCLG